MTEEHVHEFAEAVLDLQEVIRRQQAADKAREYFTEQRDRELAELEGSRYLYTDEYRKMAEAAGTWYPPLSFDETAREIKDHYAELIKTWEVGIRDKADPTGSKRWSDLWEAKTGALFKKFQEAVVMYLSVAFTPAMSISSVSSSVDRAAKDIIVGDGEKVVKEIVPKAYQQGAVFAMIQLGAGPGEKFAKEKALALLIENGNGKYKYHSSQSASEVNRVIAEGILREKTLGQIVKDIKDRVDWSEAQARRAVRTETMKAVNQGVKDRYDAAGITDEEEFWLAAGDACDACAENDGKSIAEIGYYPPGHGSPDIPWNCRCTFVFRHKKKEEVAVPPEKEGFLSRFVSAVRVAVTTWYTPRIMIGADEPEGAKEGDFWLSD
jgi:SPP1 gp7 family putative phage head morphogenesis protein